MTELSDIGVAEPPASLPTTTTTPPPKLEVRSIDYVPHTERHGKARDLGTIFFMGNAQLGAMVVGVSGVAAGGNLLWSLIAIVIGMLFATVFVAFHAAQGPKLGLPQMIQTRPQFGYIGALLVWAWCFVNYFGFATFNSILTAQSFGAAVHVHTNLWIIPSTIAMFVIALVGYKLLHGLGRWLTYAFIIVFAVLTVGAAINIPLPAHEFAFNNFAVTPFLLQFGITVGYQIGWAVYVSDYSRYLPANLSVRATSGWLYGGSCTSGIWIMALGALLAAGARGSAFDPVSTVYSAANTVFPGFGVIVLLLSVALLIPNGSINLYGSSLTLLSSLDSFVKVKPTLAARAITLGLTSAGSLIIALALSNNFLDSFENFLLLLLYVFIPWTAINLADFYIVRHGHYAVSEIFKPDGIYGRWGWAGLIAYLVGLAVEIPFVSTPLFTGPVAKLLNGGDISLFIGLPVSAGLYLLLSRSYDLEHERAVAAADEIDVAELRL